MERPGPPKQIQDINEHIPFSLPPTSFFVATLVITQKEATQKE